MSSVGRDIGRADDVGARDHVRSAREATALSSDRLVACLLAGQQQSAIDEASVTHTESARSVKEVVAVFSKVPRNGRLPSSGVALGMTAA
jgi:hypothetical protein